MNKTDLLKKLKALANDERANENERKLAEERLNELMKKYHINSEEINSDVLIKREFYFKESWELTLIGQTIYMLFPDKKIYKNSRKRNWVWCEMTDAEYLEFEMYYCPYKASFAKELKLFITAFISKNNIFPPNVEKSPNPISRTDRMKIAMMSEGIENVQIRRQLNEQNK